MLMRRYFSSSEAQMTNIQKRGPKTLSKSAGLLHTYNTLASMELNGEIWQLPSERKLLSIAI